MLQFFTHPEFLAVAAALVSVPIIIHLINRMRFKRVRWAAMEFLLKAQKRSRRRLIIEQLLLLMLRCFLVALVGLLVMRFVGFSIAEFGTKQSLHIVLLDDTLSMSDQFTDGDATRDAFEVAKKDILIDKIVKAVSQSSASDQLMVVPLSQAVQEGKYEPKMHDRLTTEERLKKLKSEIENIAPTKQHVDLVPGVKVVKQIALNNPESAVTVHVLSDFRQKVWGRQEGELLQKEIVEMAKNKVKVRLVDTAHPFRSTGQAGVPLAHDNVGITEFRPSTRIAGKDMPVVFTVAVANYGSRVADVHVVVTEDANGGERFDIDFNPPMPLKIKPGETVQATFDMRFNPNIKANETYFAQVSARLENAQRGKLEGDSLLADNLRQVAVEIREKVPVLVLDGEAKAGRAEGRDSFHIRTALVSVPGGSYDVHFGDELGGGVAAKALERPDLLQYPQIFILNVREFTPKQLANLENYIKEGGGVAFFLGPQVSPGYYNKSLYKEGKGLFPVPLKEPFVQVNQDEGTLPQVLLHATNSQSFLDYPIFGPIFKDQPDQINLLRDLPIKSYFQAPRGSWNPKVVEIATLSNESQPRYDTTIKNIEPQIRTLASSEEFEKYKKGLDRHLRNLRSIVDPSAGKKSHHLAQALDEMLSDKGKEKLESDFPNLTEFWKSTGDPRIRSLEGAVKALRDELRYGDPLVVAQPYGKGKVVAVMTTAGKDWNEWGGGSSATVLYEPFIWELQNYLSSQGSEANLTVGTPVDIVVDLEPFKSTNKRLKATRTYYKAHQGKPAEAIAVDSQFAQEKANVASFRFTKSPDPGLYATVLQFDDSDKKLASFGHVYNVDTLHEGPMNRVSLDDIKSTMLDQVDPGQIQFEGTAVAGDSLVNRRSDLSESPWLFLLFLAVLVAEQALAVHLSFHLRGKEGDALVRATEPRQAVAV